MFDNKLLVSLYVLMLDKQFELFIPVDEKVGNIVKLLDKSLFENVSDLRKRIVLNLDSGNVYKNNDIIRNTDIKNDTKLVLI